MGLQVKQVGGSLAQWNKQALAPGSEDLGSQTTFDDYSLCVLGQVPSAPWASVSSL